MKELLLTDFFGLPYVAWGGLGTFLLFLVAAFIAYRNVKLNDHKVSMKWHGRCAYLALVLAVLHGLFGFIVFS